METREELEKRVERLEKEIASIKGTAYRGIRKRAGWGLGNLPFYDIALGPDLSRGELRGHARGVIAVGDIATGVLAVGGWPGGWWRSVAWPWAWSAWAASPSAFLLPSAASRSAASPSAVERSERSRWVEVRPGTTRAGVPPWERM